METNKKLLRIKALMTVVCGQNDTYEKVLEGLKGQFTHLTDPNSPRKQEFNKKYAVVNLAESESFEGPSIDFGDGKRMVVEYYLYQNNPDDIIIFLNLLENNNGEWFPKSIELFILEKK